MARCVSRRRALERRIQAWAAALGNATGKEHHDETHALNAELRECFTEIRIANTATETVITAHPRPAPIEGRYPPATEVRVGKGAWVRALRAAGQAPRRQASWSDEEI